MSFSSTAAPVVTVVGVRRSAASRLRCLHEVGRRALVLDRRVAREPGDDLRGVVVEEDRRSAFRTSPSLL